MKTHARGVVGGDATRTGPSDKFQLLGPTAWVDVNPPLLLSNPEESGSPA